MVVSRRSVLANGQTPKFRPQIELLISNLENLRVGFYPPPNPPSEAIPFPPLRRLKLAVQWRAVTPRWSQIGPPGTGDRGPGHAELTRLVLVCMSAVTWAIKTSGAEQI